MIPKRYCTLNGSNVDRMVADLRTTHAFLEDVSSAWRALSPHGRDYHDGDLRSMVAAWTEHLSNIEKAQHFLNQWQERLLEEKA